MDANRLEAERTAIAERFPDVVPSRVDPGVPTFEGVVPIDGVAYRVRLVLPKGYPALPPEVGELDHPGGQYIHPQGGMHRFPDGSICLFPHGNDPQAWRRQRRAVEALDRFVELKRREFEVIGQKRQLYRARWRLVIPQRFAKLMLAPESYGSLRLRVAGGGDGFVDALRFDRPQLPQTQANSPWVAADAPEQWFPWIHQAFAERPWPEIGRCASDLDDNLRAALPEAVYKRISKAHSICLVREGLKGDSADLAMFFKKPEHIGALYTPEVCLAEPEDLVFQRVDGVLNDRDKLSHTAVLIVGLGSLGSAVALALARVGVKRFTLVDPDCLALDNVCRHIGRVRDIGRSKVDVVHEAILAVNPTAEVEEIPKWFGWDLPQFSAGIEVERFAAEPGPRLLISACAVERSEHQLNELAVRHDVPIVFGAALGAAEHARVFRVMPGKTPCYACIVAAQNREPVKYPRFAVDGVDAEHRPYFDPSLPGLGIDITTIAMIVARMSLQVLLQQVGVCGVLGREDDHILWTNRGGWVFDRPLQSSAERFVRDLKCPVCGETSDD